MAITNPNLLPFAVLHEPMTQALKATPFGLLVGTNPLESSIVLRTKPLGEGEKHTWAWAPLDDPNNVAVGRAPFSDARSSKILASESVSITKIKWEMIDQNQDMEKIESPVNAQDALHSGLIQKKYEQRFPIEIIGALTSGTRGVTGRFDYNAPGSMPLAQRLMFGTTSLGGFTAYAKDDNVTLPARVHALIGGNVQSNLSVKALRKLGQMTRRNYPHPALQPTKYIKGDGEFSEREMFYAFFDDDSELVLYEDEDFKKQQLERATDLYRQANSMVADRVFAVVGNIVCVRANELRDYASFDQNGLNPAGPYRMNMLVGADALRMVQSSLSNGLRVRSNKGEFQSEEDEAVKLLASYYRGYKTPAYYNGTTKGYNGDGVTNSNNLAENGVIYFVTKFA